MGLILRTTLTPNSGNSLSIKGSALSHAEGDGNFMYLLTNMSGSNINITGSTGVLGSFTATGTTKFTGLSNSNNTNLLTYNTTTGQLSYYNTASINVGTASYVTPLVQNVILTGSLYVTSSGVTLGQFAGNQNGYVEFSVRNYSTGISASGDIAIYADNGTVTNNYIDMGINNSGLSNTYFYGGTDFGNANDAYLYNVGGDLRIGNATSQSPYSQSLYIFSNPTATPDITISGSKVGIQKSNTKLNATLDVNGYVIISGSLNNGQYNKIVGLYSHPEGQNTLAEGDFSHTEGYFTTASGNYSHAEGDSTLAGGTYSHTEGALTTASADYSHAEGEETTASGYAAHAEGSLTIALGDYSHTEGFQATTNGSYSHAEGSNTTANGSYSHAEGASTTATGIASHAEGGTTIATGQYSHAEGSDNQSIGLGSHAEGGATKSSGSYSHTEGYATATSGSYSHAEGSQTKTIGSYSHAEGSQTTASADYSHAEGRQTVTYGQYSHAEGIGTITGGPYQLSIGQFNISSSTQSTFTIGNGSSTSNRSNLLSAQGTSVQITGSLNVTGSITLSDSVPYSSGKLTVSSFAGKSSVVDGVLVLTSNEAGSPYPTQLRFNQSGSTAGWTIQSVNQGTGYTPLILNQLGGGTVMYNTQITGSLNTSGSNTLTGNTTLSGSLEVSGSTRLHNSLFEVTGSSNFSGSINVRGDLNVISGSAFYRWGNKLFNYAQFANTASITVTQNVSGAFSLPTTYFGDGVSVVSSSRITFDNSGLYNIQFSALANQGVGTSNLHIWFRKTGSNIDNSDTLVTLGNNSQTLVAWNFAYPFSASEYTEIIYHSSAANTSFPSNAAGSGFPLAPSIIVTVSQIA